jgi:integrase
MRAQRKTRVQPSQLTRAKTYTKRLPSDRYAKDAYRVAVHRAIEKANRGRPDGPLPHWHPNQLRHSAATEIRRVFGLEAAQVALGHSRADVTQVYAERDGRLAAEVAMKIG